MLARSRGSRGSKRKSTVPNLSSRTRSQAQSDLSSLGFSYTESQETTSNSSLNLNISSQSVSAGQTVLYGSTISYVYYNYVDPTVYTYGPCQAYDSSTSYSCIGGQQNQATTITYRRRQILANGVWNGSYDECSSTSSTTGAQYTNGICGYVAPTITYGSCEAYGSPIANLGSGTQCAGTFYQTYTDYRYNTRRQILVNGSWDGSSYDTGGCGTTDLRSITSSSQVNGQCGHTTPETYGPCESYTFTQPTCNGEDSYVGNYTGYRRTSNLGNTTTSGCSSAVFTGYGECIARNVSACGGTGGAGSTCNPPCSGLSGLPCGYNNTGTYDCNGTCQGASHPPASCTCTYQDMGSYHYSAQCCPSGSANAGSVGGTSSGSCCPNINKTQKWECKSYDVTNPASTNYYDCYSVGACTAPRNPDGSRTICYV